MISGAVSHWKYPSLGSICDVRDGTHDSPKYEDDGYPLITSKNLTEGGLDFGNVNYISKADHDAIEKRSAVSDGDILYGMIGTVGNPVIVEKECEFSVKNVAIFKFDEDSLILNKYLYYVLNSDFVTRQITKESKGGTQKFVSLKVLRGMIIPLPPLETQKQIAAVLEKADQLRKDCQQMEQALNSLAQSVFIDMFGDPVSNPKGWDSTSLGNEADLLSGFAFKSREYSKNPVHVKLCRGINIFPGQTNWKSTEYWDYNGERSLSKYELEKNDIVVAMDRPWVSGGFKIAMLKQNDLPALLLQRVMRVRGETVEHTNFFYHALSQPAFLHHSNMTETTVPHISPKDLSSYKIPLPTNNERIKFYELTKKINESRDHTNQKSLEAESMFNALMQKAFKGELNLDKSAA